jgi:hypothetical protein
MMEDKDIHAAVTKALEEDFPPESLKRPLEFKPPPKPQPQSLIEQFMQLEKISATMRDRIRRENLRLMADYDRQVASIHADYERQLSDATARLEQERQEALRKNSEETSARLRELDRMTGRLA